MTSLLSTMIAVIGGATVAHAAAQDYRVATWNLARGTGNWVRVAALAREHNIVALQEVPAAPPGGSTRLANVGSALDIEHYTFGTTNGVRHLFIRRTIDLAVGIVTDFVPNQVDAITGTADRDGIAVVNYADSLIAASFHASNDGEGTNFPNNNGMPNNAELNVRLTNDVAQTLGLQHVMVLADFNRIPGDIVQAQLPAGFRTYSQVATPGNPIRGTQLNGREIDYMISNVQVPDNRWNAQRGENYGSDHWAVSFGRMMAAAQPQTLAVHDDTITNAVVALEQHSASDPNGSTVTQSPWRHSLDQVWQTLRPVNLQGQTYYQMQGMNDRRCLDTGGPIMPGMVILVLKDCQPYPDDTQIWTYNASLGRLQNGLGMFVTPTGPDAYPRPMMAKSPSPSSVLFPDPPTNTHLPTVDMTTWSSGGMTIASMQLWSLLDGATHLRIAERFTEAPDPFFPPHYFIGEQVDVGYPDDGAMWAPLQGHPGYFLLEDGHGDCMAVNPHTDELVPSAPCRADDPQQNFELLTTEFGHFMINETGRRFVGGYHAAALHALPDMTGAMSVQRHFYGAQPQTRPVPTAAVDSGYSFLSQTFDRYGSPSALRVPQSYTGGHFSPGDEFGPNGYQASFTYDNALVITAYLRRGSGDDIPRAIALGDSLLYAQAHDITPDGRLRASYEPDPFVTATGAPYVGGFSVYTGNMSWAGMALTRLYDRTGERRFLDGALRIANWIQSNAADTRGAGGYTGGLRNADGTGAEMIPITWKATEHNIDTGAFFAMLAKASGDQAWKQRSANAFAFVATMQADDGRLWTGTGLDGVTQNRDTVPEDIQTWSFLATGDTRYSRSVDWAAENLKATDGPFSGVSFGRTDTSKVWFEGTAHLLAAYNARGAVGDDVKAGALLDTLLLAQQSAPNTDGHGLVAASRDGLTTGEGDTYYASLHTGATAWYLIAAQGGNPFVL
ncbi:hypothetical protein [Kitasatospora sp. NPDC054795]